MPVSVSMLAGVAGTVIFAVSALPMLVKAARTRDLASYSGGNIWLANLGNAVYSAYVFQLPPGPIWALHTFYVISSACMLVWFIRYGDRAGRAVGRSTHRRLRGWASVPMRRASSRSYRRGDPEEAPCPSSTSRPWSSAPARPACRPATTSSSSAGSS